jgi:endonuclease YncB( thermonuclease family)
MPEYPATVLRTVDGDTLALETVLRDERVDLGFGLRLELRLVLTHPRVRLVGVDTPELPGADGARAKEFTARWVGAHGPSVTVHTDRDRRDDRGRPLVEIRSPDGTVSLNRDLLASGHATPYPRP